MEYVEQLELYFVANDIDSDEKRRAILLNACSPTAYKLFRNLAAPAKRSEVDYEDLNTLMRDHHTGRMIPISLAVTKSRRIRRRLRDPTETS